ncbi:MAG: 50S ribosomal protein L15 [Patescibacteria group bacterium]|nr:50S ribosomal protein L15 [Patescibacteria group bacterium]MBU1160639.1 50S ribosomal protein L15 [Patescibacteria group bacterium]MBU1350109.1 50S ribosomal protein L15 [Patescibacteria group bacterium]MBU1421473.1 50S ribosomal protein L15 [Patescibacteria group bacterium]MBU1684169.1 50S ribosomal protein L15 [Patescibacteria group bacterium]
MSLSLHTIKPAKRSTKKRKKIGRGNASGHGTYSGKGQKGQKCRSGVSRMKLKRLGMKSMIQQTPKVRGFKSDKPKNQVVSVADINKYFKDGDAVNPKTLLQKKLINKIKLPVKILGKEDLKLKNLKFSGVKMSESVQEKINKTL